MSEVISEARASEIMSRKLITIKMEDSLRKAYEMMQDLNIRHLPVTSDDNDIIGILSDRDLQRAMSPHIDGVSHEKSFEFNPDWEAKDFMSWPIKTVSESETIESVARRMLKEKISAVVVIKGLSLVGNQHVRGIITTDDLLKYLLKMLSTDREQLTLPLGKIMDEETIGSWMFA